MTNFTAFKLLETMDGIRHYLLVRRDGELVSQSMENAHSQASVVATSCLLCEGMEKSLGSKRFTHAIIRNADGEVLLLVSLGNFFLGVFVLPGTNPQLLLNNIKMFLRDLQAKVSRRTDPATP